MSACASCKERIPQRADIFNERLEYVSPSGKKRLRTVTIRQVCSSCARAIADNAEMTDHPAIAAMEVTSKLRDFLSPHPDEDTKASAWLAVVRSMNRYIGSAEQVAMFP